MDFGEAIKFRGNWTGWVHFPVTVVTESSLAFDVSECLESLFLSLVVGSLVMVL